LSQFQVVQVLAISIKSFELKKIGLISQPQLGSPAKAAGNILSYLLQEESADNIEMKYLQEISTCSRQKRTFSEQEVLHERAR